MKAGRFRSRPAVMALVVAGLALLVRLTVLRITLRFNPEAIWLFDSSSYHLIARHLLRHSLLTLLALPAQSPFAQRPIGYPLLMSGVYALAGVHPVAVVMLQTVLSAATVFLVYLIGRDVFDRQTGLLGALLLAVDPASITLSLLLLTETSFTFLLVLALWLLVRGLVPGGRIWWFGSAGLCLALATHVRPVGYYLLPLLGIAVLLALRFGGDTSGDTIRIAGQSGHVPVSRSTGTPWVQALTRTGALLLFPLLLVGGWQVVKLARTGSATFCSVEGVNMLFYRAAGVLALRDGVSLRDEQARLGFVPSASRSYSGYFDRHPDARDLSSGALSRRWSREGWAILLGNPLRTLVVELRGIVQTLFDPATFDLALFLGLDTRWLTGPVTHLLQHQPFAVPALMLRHPIDAGLLVLGLLFLVFVYVRAFLWVTRTRWSALTPQVLLVVGVLVYLLVVSAGPEANARFRVPMMPMLALLAAAVPARLDIRQRQSRISHG